MGLFDKLFGDKKQPVENSTLKHQEEWDSYLTFVDDKIGSIMLDLGLKNITPFTDKPNLIWVSIKMNAATVEGLSSNEEVDSLYKIEDSLVEGLTKKYDSLFVGRLTSNGRRDLYFYIGNSILHDKVISETMIPYFNYEYDFGLKEDKNWDLYHDFLYPAPEQHQSMMNRRVLNNLEKHGDNHDLPRKVDHYIYFKTLADKEAFIGSIKDTDFIVEHNGAPLEDDLLMLHLSIISPINQTCIDDCTIDLFNRAKHFNGAYDGWGCPIQKSL